MRQNVITSRHAVVLPQVSGRTFLFKDLKNIQALQVYRKGVLVAKNGKIINPKKDLVSLTKKVKSSVNYGKITADQLQIHLGKAKKMRLIKSKREMS